ncbi:MAG: DUF4412 domain-containing protein [Gammaproteobacteria bacterium]
MIETSEGDFQQTVYWTPDKVRTETELPGMSMTNIVREDLGVMWISNPMMGGCLEQAIEGAEELAQMGGSMISPENVDYEEIGSEEIDGYQTTKYKVTDTEGSTTHEAVFWVTEDNILVRMEIEPDEAVSDGSFTMRLSSLEVGPQPDELFESPGNCQKMPDMPGMPGLPPQGQ